MASGYQPSPSGARGRTVHAEKDDKSPPKKSPSKRCASEGWTPGALGQSCTKACDALGLTCKPEDMFEHNKDVDSWAKVKRLMAHLGLDMECSQSWASHAFSTGGAFWAPKPHPASTRPPKAQPAPQAPSQLDAALVVRASSYATIE